MNKLTQAKVLTYYCQAVDAIHMIGQIGQAAQEDEWVDAQVKLAKIRKVLSREQQDLTGPQVRKENG